MNVTKTLFLFLALTVALALTHLALDLRDGSGTPALAVRSALAPDAVRATRLEVVRPGQDATALVRDGGAWRIVRPFAGVAATDRVLRLLDALSFVRPEEAMTDQDLLRLGGSREDFGLDAPRLRVTTEAEGEDPTVVTFGRATASGAGVYAAVAGVEGVFIVSTNVLASADLSANGFRRRQLFDLQPASVAALDVRRGTGAPLRFERTGTEWMMRAPREAAASSARIDALLGDLLAGEADGFVWPIGTSNETASVSVAVLAGYGLDAESAISLRLRTLSGAESVVAFGKEAGEGRVYALVQNGAAVVTVDASLCDRMVAGVEALADSRLFPIEESAVAVVSLTDGTTAYLISRDAAGQWRLETPLSAPADAAGVAALVKRLVALRPSDRRDDGLLVSLATNLAPVAVDRAIVFGKFRPEDLRAKEILTVEPAQVRRLVSTAGDASTAVTYDPDRRAWDVESASHAGKVDAAAVAALVGALAPLRASTVVKLKVSAAELGLYGLATPRHTLAIDRAQGGTVRRNILIGDRAPGGRYATLGTADAVFVLPDATVRILTAPLVRE